MLELHRGLIRLLHNSIPDGSSEVAGTKFHGLELHESDQVYVRVKQ